MHIISLMNIDPIKLARLLYLWQKKGLPEIESVKEMKAKVESLPKSLPFSVQNLTTQTAALHISSAKESPNDLAEATWAEMDEELGT
jgi:hypothetical protein